MNVLLEASNEERKLRARVREATTLLGALDALLEAEDLSEGESQDEFHSNDLQECYVFVMSEEEDGTTDKAISSDAAEDDESTDDELDKEVRELNGEPKPRKKPGSTNQSPMI